jgi:hypothetical protein
MQSRATYVGNACIYQSISNSVAITTMMEMWLQVHGSHPAG